MLFDIKLSTAAPTSGKPVKILKVHHQLGAVVTEGDVLFDAEGEKGTVVIKTAASGVIQSLSVEEGATVSADTVLATIDGQQQPPAPSDFNYFGNLVKAVKQELDSDIAIIGGGPGGYVSAIKAAQMGAKVVLIEKDALGGTCLNRGCIPTKSFVRSAQVLNTVKHSGTFGVVTADAVVDMKRVVEHKNTAVSQLTCGIKHLLSRNGVTVVSGIGMFQDDHTIMVKHKNVETTVKAKNIIIATGSRPAQLPIPGIDLDQVITSDQALQLEKLPRSMVIIGGGVIGMEFAFIFANFGVEVSVVEALDQCLVACDEDICAENARHAASRGIRIFTNAKVNEIVKTETGECLVAFAQDQATKYIAAELVLLSVGRKPYTEGLGLEQLALTFNEHNRGIAVNDKMQTNIPHIYAIGDVTNKLQLAHIASHQGLVAIRNILGEPCKMDYSVVPSAIFTDPEIATVGMCEKSAKQAGVDVAVGKFPFMANGKALTYGETDGFIKLVTDKTTGKIIGGSVIGLHATDLIAEIALAIQNGLTAKQLSETIHAHPTTAEVILEAALAVQGRAIHLA
ncbi:Dihydrolipoyl dehydrogenase [Sporomusa rhizae]|uniref:dihydrolipoyl dehydrogenase n=1 Tax=Sporomusa rhizae TaxID=357999 RepID=UPI00352A5236